jgi:hypothetical protein
MAVALLLLATSRAGTEEPSDAVKDIADASTPEALEMLLRKHPHRADEVVPKVETLVLERIASNGAEGRFVIPEVKPLAGFPTGRITMRGAGARGVARLTSEFPGDTVEMRFGMTGGDAGITAPWGAGSVHRFDGRVEMDGIDHVFIGEGDKPDRLSFGLTKNVGYVYLRGKGRVISSNGKEVKLGYPANTEPSSSQRTP